MTGNSWVENSFESDERSVLDSGIKLQDNTKDFDLSMEIAVVNELATRLAGTIRDVVDFPTEGIVFKDITTLCKNAEAFAASVSAMAEPFRGSGIEQIVAAESRGFIFGAAMAVELGCGFVPVRKPGKLPAETVRVDYELEYGSDTLEMHLDAVEPGQKVLLVDDLLATGGTMGAVLEMVRGRGGDVVGASFLIELTFLPGRSQLPDVDVHTVIRVDAE